MERRQQQFHALGSDVFITLIANNDYTFDKTFSDLHEQIMAFEHRFSRFLPDSELTNFNASAGSNTSISDEFKDLLLTCKQLADATNDLYNPFVLPALQKAGYRGSWPSPDKLAGARDFSDRQVVPSQELEIDNNSAKIPLNTALDLGGIGKGYLLDKLRDFLEPANLTGYWLSLGGDIVCAGQDLENEKWSVQVQHATKQNEGVATLTNATGEPLFIATSGTTKRRGGTGKSAWHHIINPQTGVPATTDILTATVTSNNGVNADVFAKVIVIAGYQQARALKRSHRVDSYVLQYEDKKPTINL